MPRVPPCKVPRRHSTPLAHTPVAPTCRSTPYRSERGRGARACLGFGYAGLHLDGAPGSKRSSFKLLQWSSVLGRGPFKERCFVVASWIAKSSSDAGIWPALLADLAALRTRARGPSEQPDIEEQHSSLIVACQMHMSATRTGAGGVAVGIAGVLGLAAVR